MNILSFLLCVVFLIKAVESSTFNRFRFNTFNIFSPENIKAAAFRKNVQKQKLLDSKHVYASLHDATVVPPYQEPKPTPNELNLQRTLRLLTGSSTTSQKDFDVKVFQNIEGKQVQLPAGYVKALLNSWNSSELGDLNEFDKYSAFIDIMKDNKITVSIDRLDEGTVEPEAGAPKETFLLGFESSTGDSKPTKELPKPATLLLKEHGEARPSKASITRAAISKASKVAVENVGPTIYVDGKGTGVFDLTEKDPNSVVDIHESNSSGTSSLDASVSSTSIPATSKSVELDATTTKSSENATLSIVFYIIMGIIVISLGTATYMSMRKSQEESVEL